MNHRSLQIFMRLSVVLGCLILVSGCQSAYYSAMEKFGKEKRHILMDNVEAVQGSQTKAREEFKDALTRIKELYNFDGKELEVFYKKVKTGYEDCEDRAKQIESRIMSVKRVADDLFKEWETEITQISDQKMKSSSRQSLSEARVKYAKLEAVMERSARQMYPVLTKLKDYVLYLKHNLNAKAVGSLRTEVTSIEKEVARLIADMNASIEEANRFINDF